MGLEIILLLGLAAGYITKSLVLEEKDTHVGPFQLKATFISFPDTGHIQQACLFDIIRFMFGAYYKAEEQNEFQRVYEVHPIRSERFTCPFCLSFWVALFFSIPAMFFFQINPLLFPVVHFSVATLSTLFVGALNYALRV